MAESYVISEPAPEEAVPPEKTAPANRSSLWLILILLLVLAGLAVCALLALMFIPAIRERTQSLPNFEQTVVLPAIVEDSPTIVVATNVASTSPPPTSVAPVIADEATAVPSPSPFPTITPLADAPTPTPIIGIIMPPVPTGTPNGGTTTINVIQNGDFSDDWANGWSLETAETNGSQVIEQIPPGFDAPGQVLSMGKTGSGTVELRQRAVLNDRTANAVFRARLRQSGTVYETAGVEGRSALILVYESADGAPQGASLWFDNAADQTGLWSYPPLSELGPSLMARYATDRDWQDIEIALDQEFKENLPDINPDDIRQVTVILLLIADEDCPAESCMATLEAADVQLLMPFP